MFLRFLVVGKYKVYQFIHLIREKIKMKEEDALYLFVKEKTLLKSGILIT